MEKGRKRQRAHKVYAKIANCLKNSTMSVKIGPILEISAAPQSLPRDKIYGPGGGAVPRSPRIPKAWPSRLSHQCSWHGIHDTTSGAAFCLVSVACLTSLSRSKFIVYFLNICTTLSASTYNLVCTETFPGFCWEGCNI